MREKFTMDPLKKMAEFEPTKKAFSLVDEFKHFAFKGSVVDLAIGVIIGAAFGKIITSLVENIFTPLLGLVLPDPKGIEGLVLVINGKPILYGKFLADVLTFLIVAFTLFLFISKFLGWVMHHKKEEAAAPPPLTKEQELLMEIRDLLAKQKQPTEGA